MKTTKYHICGMQNNPYVLLWESDFPRTFAPRTNKEQNKNKLNF